MDLSTLHTAQPAAFPLQRPAMTPETKAARLAEKAEDTAREFESVFIAEMMKPMFEGLETGGPFGGGKGEEVFRGMLIQEYGKIIAQNGSIGLSSQVREAIIQMQAKADGNTSLPPAPSSIPLTPTDNGAPHHDSQS